MKHVGRIPPFRRTGERVPFPGSIAEVQYLRLGGIDQWVMIRGESVENPPLVFLHGGPGFSETRMFRHFNAPIERRFTVVYWDQRGTARSFSRGVPRASMTVEQFVADLDELIDTVSRRLGKSRVVILGHSWGSLLGVLYAARFPQKVAAYVGTGQIGDWAKGEAASYAWAVAEAERLGRQRELRKLRAIGPPPYDARSVFTERTALQRIEGELTGRAMLEVGRILFGRPEGSILDLLKVVRGFRFSLHAMWPEVSRLNLLELVPELPVPVFLFLGRRDHWVPPETSLAWFDALNAPSKELHWFEESGHLPFVDEPEKFSAALVERVWPVAAANG